MQRSDEFWALRNCFLPPIAELEEALDLLDRAADALLTGDGRLARELVRAANIPIVHLTAKKIMNTVTPEIHRLRRIDRPAAAERAPLRMPGGSEKTVVFVRDGWHCRFCGVRVISPQARKAMVALLPDAICWNGPSANFHAAFYAVSATLDHILPHSVGGTNDTSNLVTTCWPCNFGRGAYLVEEVGLADPRTREPILDGWDGLNRLVQPPVSNSLAAFKLFAKPARIPAESSSHLQGVVQSNRDWFAELNRIEPDLSGQMLGFLASCEDLQISWGLKKTWIVRMDVNDILVQIFGIDPNGDVHIPWAIGEQKEHFRSFTQDVAAAIPGAIAYESPRMWIVGKASKEKVTIIELLKAAPSVRAALARLHEALRQITADPMAPLPTPALV